MQRRKNELDEVSHALFVFFSVELKGSLENYARESQTVRGRFRDCLSAIRFFTEI